MRAVWATAAADRGAAAVLRRVGAVEVLDEELLAVEQPEVDRGQPAVDAASHLRADRRVRQALGQRVGHAAAPVRRHLRAAATHGELAGVGADHGNARDSGRAEREQPVVDQQDRSLGRHLPGHGAPSRVVLLPLRAGSRQRAVEHAHPRHQPQQVADLAVDHGLVDEAVAHGGGQGRAEPGRGARHLEVEAGPRGGDSRVGAEPVRHHQPVEAPFVPEYPINEVGLLAAVDAIDLVVRGHHRPDAGLAHGGFEGDEVNLPECALGDLGADGHPLVLLVVAGVVLDAAPHPGALHPLHVGDRQARRQQRVLGEGLEGASGQRRARDADRRPEQHVDALGVRLGGEHFAEALHQRRIPGRADRHAAGQRQRTPPDQAVAPDARRAVGHLEGRQA